MGSKQEKQNTEATECSAGHSFSKTTTRTPGPALKGSAETPP